ncbi:hypothetical protein F4553_006065 [Allocatelliglobosispora scoriae]|uniref:Uncharacterized protein n=1 Tax=Allocatelliglobosispora scoriae TaxID=643052 RepID=A0A841C179_9ACTN|nr:hypothetical protein [Allocatelliglobosispora scoriae]
MIQRRYAEALSHLAALPIDAGARTGLIALAEAAVFRTA